MKALQFLVNLYSAPKPSSAPIGVLVALVSCCPPMPPMLGSVTESVVFSHAPPPLIYTRVRSATTPPIRPETVASQLLEEVQKRTTTQGVVPLTFIPTISPSTPTTTQPA